MSTCVNPFQSTQLASFQHFNGMSPFSGRSSASTSSMITILASSILFSSVDDVDGIITNISVIQGPTWFFMLTPYETVFLGFVGLWLCLLQYLGITPLNINNLFTGDPSGKKRRKRASALWTASKISLEKLKSVENLLATLNRIDSYKCIYRTLCELQNYSQLQNEDDSAKLPRGIELILDVFSASQRKIHDFSQTNGKGNGSTGTFPKKNSSPIQQYEEAIEFGRVTSVIDATSNHTKTTNLCLAHYSECPLTLANILNYVDEIQLDTFLS